jgi:hypothetical protein
VKTSFNKWENTFPNNALIHQAKTEWANLSKEEKKKMETLLTLAIEMLVAGLSDDIKDQNSECSKIFLKVLIQEWRAAKQVITAINAIIE